MLSLGRAWGGLLLLSGCSAGEDHGALPPLVAVVDWTMSADDVGFAKESRELAFELEAMNLDDGSLSLATEAWVDQTVRLELLGGDYWFIASAHFESESLDPNGDPWLVSCSAQVTSLTWLLDHVPLAAGMVVDLRPAVSCGSAWAEDTGAGEE